jgi:hypothetical protein
LAYKSQERVEAEHADAQDREQQAAADLREELIDTIVKDWSPAELSQSVQRAKLRYASTEALQEKVQVIKDRKRFRAMPPDELKRYIKTQREAK